MHSAALLSTLVLLIPLFAQAEINDSCTANGLPGICISTANCASADGVSRTGFCPNDPDDIKCCTTKCGPATEGKCQFNSTCESGVTLTGLCPGPSDFQCCIPPAAASLSSAASSVLSVTPISSFSQVFGSSSSFSFTARPTASSSSASTAARTVSSSGNTTSDEEGSGSDGSASRMALGAGIGVAAALAAVALAF